MEENDEKPEINRRMRVARAWGRFSNNDQLAAAIGEDGLGAATLGGIERGTRPLLRSEALVIAEACGVSVDLLMNEDYDPFSARPAVDPEVGSGAFLQAVAHALEELLDRDGPRSAALAELRQLRQLNQSASGRSEPGRE